jgi:hypothetical protein
MATRLDMKTYERDYFEYLFPMAYPNTNKKVEHFIRDEMIPNGDITIESLAETAFSQMTGIKKISTIGKDFVNGMDMKKATAFVNPNRPRVEARITSFQAKVGSLITLVYEPFTKKFYWFKFPSSFYRLMKTVTVYFDLDGTPRTKNIRADGKAGKLNAWNYCIHQPAKGKNYVKRIA